MKKGFTLMELLGIIVILSIITLLVFPNVIKIINNSRENLYKSQIRELELVAKNLTTEHINLLDSNHLNNTYIPLSVLSESGYIESVEVRNPKTNELMNGCIVVKYDDGNNQYNFNYEEIDCINDSNISGYIISFNRDFKIEERNILLTAYNKILGDYKDLISIIGGETDGLYDMDDYYIFRGTNPNNYVKLGQNGDSYRIVNLNKKDKTLKLIKITPESSAYSTSNNNQFIESSISTYLLNFITTGSIKEFQNKIVDGTKWKNGVTIIDDSVNYDILKSIENTSYISNRAGLINISDYVIASLENDCYNNVLSSTCKNNNYLSTLFGSNSIWTINSSRVGNVFTIENGNIIDHVLDSNSDVTYRIYPVVVMDKNIYISKGTGTSSDPYIIN